MENQNILNQKLLLTVKRLGINGEGIAYYKRKAVFIPNAIPGEVVEVKITKHLEKYAYGEVLQYKQMSEYRVKPRCEYYGRCGGCQLQHMAYPFQLEQKKAIVEETIDKYFEGKSRKFEIRDCLGMNEPWAYRNKTQLPTRHDGDKVVVGMYELDSNRLVYINKCLIESKLISEIMHIVLDYLTKASINVYNPRFQQGNLRYIVIRGFEETNEVQVTYVVMKEEPRLTKILTESIKLDQRIKSVHYSVNNDHKSIEIMTSKVVKLAGKDQIDGKLGDLSFSISPNAFFQLNNSQTKVLYNEVLKALNPTGKENVLDLYCGIGSIGLYVAKQVNQVRGVDINQESIANANEFASINGLNNAKFYAGNILKQLDKFEKEGFIADVVIVDPPRKGVELQVLHYLQKKRVKKIIYVSCNPATLVKNLNHLQKEYVIRYIQPVDMFPQTSNVETVVLLSKGEVDSKKIRVEFSLEDMDMSEFQDGATYPQIKEYVLEHTGLKVSNLYISQIKRKCGIEVGKNYNLPKSEDSRQPQCPPEKEKAIREAFKYFGMM